MTLVAPLSTRGHCWRCNRLTETLRGAGRGMSRSTDSLTSGYVLGYVVEGAGRFDMICLDCARFSLPERVKRSA